MHFYFGEAAQRIGSPAADFNKTRLHEITFSTKWPPHTRAEGGQVEPVLGGSENIINTEPALGTLVAHALGRV